MSTEGVSRFPTCISWSATRNQDWPLRLDIREEGGGKSGGWGFIEKRETV